MKLVDLKREYRVIRRAINAAVEKTIRSGSFILGKSGSRLEEKIAKLVGVPYAVGVNSGTDALFLALKALGVGLKDEVITTPFTFVATAEVIVNCGARPVFVDINPRTYNIDPGKIERAITKRTRAIIPVHLYGQMADMKTIMQIAKRKSLLVIEDAAQALGAKIIMEDGGWRMAGSLADVGCFSFFPAKNLGAYGDAGMVTTHHKTLAQKIRLLRNHGARKKYSHEILGYSSRLDELQAAVLLAKLPHLTKWNALRRKLAGAYSRKLAEIPGLQVPFIERGNLHVFQQYVIRTPECERLRDFLLARGIPTAVHYPLPLHLQRAFRFLGYRRGSFPEAERAAAKVLSLPIHPYLRGGDQRRIISFIKKFFASR